MNTPREIMKPSQITALLLILAATFALSFTKASDQDVFWHLRTGQLILDEGRLPRTNTFSSAHADHPWLNPNWLFQASLAGIHRLGGWGGVAAFKVVLASLVALCLLLVLLGERRGALAAGALTVAVMAVLQFRILARPHLVSYLFFAVLILATFLV